MTGRGDLFVRAFDAAADDYRAAVGPFVDAVADLVVDRAEVRPGATVVDLATGPATVPLALPRHGVRQADVLGVDLAERPLGVGRKLLTAAGFKARLARGDAENVDVKDRSVDAVTCSLGLPYFGEPLRALREGSRMGRRGAPVVCSTFGRPLFGGAGERLLSTFDRCEAPQRHGALSHDAETLAQWCFRAGLGEVVIEEHDVPVRYADFAGWWAACRALGFLVRLDGVGAEVVEEVQGLLREDTRVVEPSGEVVLLVRVLVMRGRVG